MSHIFVESCCKHVISGQFKCHQCFAMLQPQLYCQCTKSILEIQHLNTGLTPAMLNLDITYNRNQCIFISDGFIRSHLITICTVFYAASESNLLIEITQLTWLVNRSECVKMIYSAEQGLRYYFANISLLPYLQAEELMRKIEKEEEQVAYQDPDKKIYHLCIVNLVIG